MAKDLFSGHADIYAKYRPSYPTELFDHIISFVNEKYAAWDCATGNGQAAAMLAEHFTKVEATDISEVQLQNAIQKPNIHYSVQPAEKTNFLDDSFDLITVAQAYHWLHLKSFHDEATRVAKPRAVVAVWAYGLLSCENSSLNKVIQKFYSETIHNYWEYERKFVDEEYQTIDFNFDPLPSKEFSINANWDKENLKGYLSSWSAVQKFARENNASPLAFIDEGLDNAWGSEEKIDFTFPLFLKIGRVVK